MNDDLNSLSLTTQIHDLQSGNFVANCNFRKLFFYPFAFYDCSTPYESFTIT